MPVRDAQTRDTGTAKRRVNLTLDSGLVSRARAEGLNLSALAEAAVAAALAQRAKELDAAIAQACRVHEQCLAEYGSLGKAVRVGADAAGGSPRWLDPRWLEIVRHRVRGFRTPCLLVLQHHDIPAATRLAAAVTLPLPGEVDVLAPRLPIDGADHRARVLDMSAVPRGTLADTVASAAEDADAIMGALDIILHG